MWQMAGISHRYSRIDPAGGFYEYGQHGGKDVHAPEFAVATVDRRNLGDERHRITFSSLVVPAFLPLGSTSR
jgi:hypothetical protein